MKFVLDDEDDDDVVIDIFVGVSVGDKIVGVALKIPTGGDLLLSSRGRWHRWRRCCPFSLSDCCCYVVVVVVVVVVFVVVA